MNNSYKVEELQMEEITLKSAPRPAPRQRDATYFRQFINNVALAVVTGDVDIETVRKETTNAVFDMVSVAIERFDALQPLYASRSSLGGVDEFLSPEFFTFSGNFNNTTH